METSQRIDKWLWCVRIYKTRTLAAEACLGGKVKLNTSAAKPSKDLKPGDRIDVRKGPVTYSYEVNAFPRSRISASDILLYYKDLTDSEELKKLEEIRLGKLMSREKGTGRPTKKDRRDINRFRPD